MSAAPATGCDTAILPSTPLPIAVPPRTGLATEQGAAAPAVDLATMEGTTAQEWLPVEPKSLEDAGLSHREVEGLTLKYLLNCGANTGRGIAEQLRLPFYPLAEFLGRLKRDRLLAYKAASAASDYVYELTDIGAERAHRYVRQSTYFGAAPVPLNEYIASVKAQSLTQRKPNLGDLCRAFGDLTLSRDLLIQLGQAVHSGRGLFLYGAAGNGKTSIAERITRSYGEGIWIPRTISVWGEIIRLYDPSVHDPLPLPPSRTSIIAERTVDQRWVRVKRPTIVAGGELTLNNLELANNEATGVNEAPLQLKSNCGTLVIDDFGRQRISIVELLNRWIVPLEKRFDFLNLTSGVKIQVPFDQLLVFSTNLEPRDLVDEAFFRRIPYKINVPDPSETEFRALWAAISKNMGIETSPAALEYLLTKHYKSAQRPLRFCHPRDILLQIANFCSLQGLPKVATREAIDSAAKNYFSVL